MENIVKKLVAFLLKKYTLGYLVKGWSKLRGYKTQIFAVLTGLVWVGEVTGQIPKDTASQLYAVFGSGAGFAFMQKLTRYQPEIEDLIKDVKQGEKK